jgi:hypothetical protein
MATGLETFATQIMNFMLVIAPLIAVILFVFGGIIYGLSFTQPADSRGKWQTAGVSMVIGALVIGAIAGIASQIPTISGGFLKG